MTMVSFIAGAFISTAVLASGYMAPSTMSVQCDQLGNGRGIEAKTLLGDRGNEVGTGLEIRIVELAVALVLFEMGSVLGCEECAQVMIEPPGDFGRTRILEVHDGVFVAIKLSLIKQCTGAVQQAGKYEACVVADALAVETRKKGSRTAPSKHLS